MPQYDLKFCRARILDIAKEIWEKTADENSRAKQCKVAESLMEAIKAEPDARQEMLYSLEAQLVNGCVIEAARAFTEPEPEMPPGIQIEMFERREPNPLVMLRTQPEIEQCRKNQMRTAEFTDAAKFRRGREKRERREAERIEAENKELEPIRAIYGDLPRGELRKIIAFLKEQQDKSGTVH